MHKVKGCAVHSVEQFGERLKQARKALGWSQQQAADAVAVRREMWAKWEAGAEPGAKALAGMATAGLDVLYLLLGNDAGTASSASPLPADERKLLKRYRALGEVQREQALNMLKVLALGGSTGGHTNIVKGNKAGSLNIGSIHGGTQHIKPDES